jgi:hypothetical protein
MDRLVFAIQSILPDAMVKGLFGEDGAEGRAKGGIIGAYTRVVEHISTGLDKIFTGFSEFFASFKTYATNVSDAFKDDKKSILSKMLSPITEIKQIVKGFGKMIGGILSGTFSAIMGTAETYGMEYKVGEMMKESRKEVIKNMLSESFYKIYAAIEDRIFEWGKAAFQSMMDVFDFIAGGEGEKSKGIKLKRFIIQ